MSWPYSPQECPHCRYLEPIDPPTFDEVGYQLVGLCRHPRIAMELFVLQERDPATMEPCPCFRAKNQAA